MAQQGAVAVATTEPAVVVKEHVSDLPPDIERFKQHVIEFVEKNDLRAMFIDLQKPSPDQDFDEMLAIHAVTIITKMELHQKTQFWTELVRLVYETSDVYVRQRYERVIDRILHYCYEEGVMSIALLVTGTILTADFSLKTTVNKEKWKFIEENITQLDYKEIRNVFKHIIDTQFPQVPTHLTPDQRRQFIPIENVVLLLLDMERNVIPPLFALIEFNNCAKKLPKIAHALPRVSRRLSEMKLSQRPVAELCYVVGRSFMFPQPAHPAFHASSNVWRIDSASTRIVHRFPFLPYRQEYNSSQTYLLYMVIRQPHGKEFLSSMMRSTGAFTKAEWSDLILVLICETMAQVEQLPPGREIPRYQWENLRSIVIYGISNDNISMTKLLGLLIDVLTRTKYRKARDEVMWLLLQVEGVCSQKITQEIIEEMAKLYNVLFSDEVTFAGASNHPSQMARFLAAACLWIMLEGKPGLPAPSESLGQQIQFVRQNTPDNKAILAVLANANAETYRDVFGRFISALEGQQGDEPFYLSYGRSANGKLKPFDVEFLDALTIRSKVTLKDYLAKQVLNLKLDRLPSPASIDTLARIIWLVEAGFGLKPFLNAVKQAIAVASEHRETITRDREYCYVLLDVLCYRLSGMHVSIQDRQIICQTIISAMGQQNIQNCSALYNVMEQILMRQFAWMPFQDTLMVTMHFLSKYIVILNPSSFYQNIKEKALPFCPEIARILLINSFHNIKLMGVETSEVEAFHRINRAYTWPDSLLATFPPTTVPHPAHLITEYRNNISSLLKTVVDDMAQLRGLGDLWKTHIMKSERQQPEIQFAQPTIMCCIFQDLFEKFVEQQQYNPTGIPLQPLSPIFYHVLEHMTAKEITQATTALANYVVARVQDNGFEVSTAIRTLNAMIFHYHVVTFDKLLLALILHPVIDDDSTFAVCIVQHLIAHNDISQRIQMYCSIVPKKEEHPSEFFKAIAEYHRKFPEFSYAEMRNAQIIPPTVDIIYHGYHMPSYYGSLIERLLPIMDYTLARVLELRNTVHEEIFTIFLNNFKGIYKYHPAPITYLYTVLYCLYPSIQQDSKLMQRARNFALCILCPEYDQQRPAAHPHPLTPSFANYNHQRVPLEQILLELVDRIITSSEFVLTPPPYVAQDWRFGEFAPSAQALFLAAIELLASPQNPKSIIQAAISLLTSHPQTRPYTTLNAIAILITALPDAFGRVLLNEFVEVMKDGRINNMSYAEIVFDNFEESLLLYMGNDAIVISALLQAFWHHGNLQSLVKFFSFIVDEVAPLVKTELELWYCLRLVAPLLQRCHDAREKFRHLAESLKVVLTIYRKIAELTEIHGDIKYGDSLCDLLYHWKYVFVGDFLKEGEQYFPKFPPRMRERLKFFSTPSRERVEQEAAVAKASNVSRPDNSVLAASVASQEGGNA